MKKIKFYTIEAYLGAIPEPVPAEQMAPDWFKAMRSKTDEKKATPINNSTIKMCPGIIDSFSYGYIMPAWCDLTMWWDEKNQLQIETAWVDKSSISAVTEMQFPNFNLPKNHRRVMIKLTMPWKVETDPGTSILVTHPKWRSDNFALYEGIVDSDNYINDIHAIISFDPSEKVNIKRGQPLVQIIPLIREDWRSEVKIWGDKESKKFNKQQNTLFSHGVCGYMKHFWRPKKFY